MSANNAANAASKIASLRARITWPIIIVVLLGTHATLILGAVTLAVGGPGRGVVPDYYREAVDFDAHKADLAASARLGWAVTLTPGSLIDADGRRVFAATLMDAQGQPISGANVSVRLIRLVDGEIVELQLSPVAERLGVYETLADLPAAGAYQADLVAVRGESRFMDRREIKAAGGIDVFADEREVAP